MKRLRPCWIMLIAVVIMNNVGGETIEGVDKMSDSIIIYETIAREGKTFEQYLAVAYSLKNRVGLGWYTSAREAALAPYQYSSWLQSEHNKQTERTQKELTDAKTAWEIVNSGSSGDFPITHFYTGNNKPSWADKMKYLCTISTMKCYQEIR